MNKQKYKNNYFSKILSYIFRTKLKHREARVKELKSMIGQIKEQMELMAEEY